MIPRSERPPTVEGIVGSASGAAETEEGQAVSGTESLEAQGVGNDPRALNLKTLQP